MKKWSSRQYAVVLHQLLAETSGSSVDEAIAAFVQLLAKRQAIHQASSIIDAFVAYEKELAGQRTISVATARPLSASLLKSVASHFGKAVETENTVDEQLIGGIVVRDGNTIFDGSLRAQLKRLAASLS